jgi:hypothetical protein
VVKKKKEVMDLDAIPVYMWSDTTYMWSDTVKNKKGPKILYYFFLFFIFFFLKFYFLKFIRPKRIRPLASRSPSTPVRRPEFS